MRAHKCLSLKDKFPPYLVLRELPGFVHTIVRKFDPITRPLFCNITGGGGGGGGGNDGRQHVKYIFVIIYLFCFRLFH